MWIFYLTLTLYMCMLWYLCILCSKSFNLTSTDVDGVNIILGVNCPCDRDNWSNRIHINRAVGLKPVWNEHQKYIYDNY